VLSVVMGATLIARADGTAIYDAANNYKLVIGAGGVFAGGMARFMNVVGVPTALGGAVGAIFLTVMALTVMQLVLRFMRVASAELLGDRMPVFKNPHVGSLIAIALTLFLVYAGYWQWLWVLFGGSNQLFAGMALLLITIWLDEQGKRYNWTFTPGMFMYVTTAAALLWTSWLALDKGFLHPTAEMTAPFRIGNAISALFGLYMAVSAVILLVDGIKAFNKARSGATPAPAPGD